MSHAASPAEGPPPQPSLRDAILDRLAAHAADPRSPPLILVEGPCGAGKTTLLRRLGERLPADVTAISVDLDAFSSGSDAEESLMQYRFFLDLLHELAAGAKSGPLDEFATMVDEEYERARSRTDDAVLPDVHRMARRFVTAWNAATTERRAVVLGDGASDALREPVGQWFVSLGATKLSNTLVVLARTSGPNPLPTESAIVERLSGLSPAEVAEVLEEQLGAPPPRGVVDRIVLATGGHPDAVSKYASLLRRHGGAEEHVLGHVTDPPAELRQALDGVARAMRAPLTDEAQQALELAAVPRRFDIPLLAKLVSGNESSEAWKQKMRETVRTLEEFGLVEYREEPGTRGSFVVHPFLRSTINRELRRDPDRKRRLHESCDGYYEMLIDARPEGYEGGSALEEAQYNADASEFLYHFQYTTAPQAPLMFLTTYFNPFWWWGWYTKCEFCEEMVRDEAYRTSPWAARWHEMLRQFHDAYPRGADPEGDWSGTYAPLEKLLTVTVEGAPGMEAKRNHLRAILTAFLGQAYQFSKRDLHRAREWYQESEDLFRSVGRDDAWNVPWMLFRRADLERALGKREQAPRIAQEAIDLAEEQNQPSKRDYEVIANCYRVIGDVEVERDVAAAFGAYARAALAAYVFQGWPQPADEYTADFYGDVTGHIHERLEALAGNAGDATSARDTVRRVWAAAGISAPEDGGLFPPGPAPGDLDDKASDYVVSVRQVTPAAVRALGSAT
jgi:hypothetical protein